MKRTFHMYLTWRKWNGENDIRIELLPFPSRTEENLWTAGVIGEVDVDVEFPDDFDQREAQLAALRMEKQKVEARLTAEIARIDGEIGKLLALEYKATA